METFQVALEIGDSRGQKWETVESLVDTGSTYTWIPRQFLERLDVRPQFQREFETADGRVLQRDMATTMVRWNGETMPTLVVFCGESDAVLLGAYTLEGFALAPDPVNRRLVRVRGLAMATPAVMAVMEEVAFPPCRWDDSPHRWTRVGRQPGKLPARSGTARQSGCRLSSRDISTDEALHNGSTGQPFKNRMMVSAKLSGCSSIGR